MSILNFFVWCDHKKKDIYLFSYQQKNFFIFQWKKFSGIMSGNMLLLICKSKYTNSAYIGR